ncbi:MAG: InlB B-repeat-containing protein [Pseudomonadota bacterium]
MKFKGLWALAFMFFFLVGAAVPALAADFYVQASMGDDANPGDDWGAGRAAATVTRGLELAQGSPGADTVHVAAGTYRESLTLPSELELLGGYPAGGGVARDMLANPTVLDGNNAFRPLFIQAAAGVTVDGFYIENGNNPGRGGGVCIEDSSGVVIRNNVVRNNQAVGDWGGGLAVVNSNVLIDGNTITGNQTDGNGGGLSFWDNCTGSVSSNTIDQNLGYYGGGMILDGSPLRVDGNAFNQNTANYGGGGIYADNAGAAVITGNTFSGNLAYSTGGGIYQANGSLSVSHNTFYGNDSRGWGGAVALYEAAGTYFDNLMVYNEATEVGGGMSIYSSATATVGNNTFSGNQAGEEGGGLYCHDGSTATIGNSILWGNSPNQIFDHGGLGVTVNNSDVQGGYLGVGNIDEDPLFSGGYYLSQTASGQGAQSPAVDAGGDTAANLGLDARTTRTDGVADAGVADLGFHYAGGGQYTVTFIAGVNGGLQGETTQTVPQGGACTPVTATGDPGYHFSGWSGGFVGPDNPLILTNVNSDLTVTANFAAGPPPTYAVTFDAGPNGSLQGETNQAVEYGQDSTPVTAVPDPGYEFQGWSGDFFGNDNPLTVAKVTGDMNITANFGAVEHTVTFLAGPNGSLIGTTTQAVLTGEAATPVEAAPDPGYHFLGWTGDYNSTDNPLTVDQVFGDMTITANFEADAATYTVDFTAGDHGSLEGEANQVVDAGGDATAVTAVPDLGYHFTGWTGDHEGTENPLTITGVNSNLNITANFAINSYTVTFLAGPNGSLNGATAQSVFHGFNTTPVEAVPGPGYHFAGWTGDHAGTENPLTLANVTSDLTVTANFAINTYTVTFLAGANGGLTGQTTQTVAHGADASPVTAVPDPGFHFASWTGDHVGTENPLTLANVTSNLTVTANFEINTYTVTFLAGANGGLTGQTTQTVAHGGACSPVTADPDPDFHFAGWTGGHVGTENPLTLTNVTSDLTVTAEFEPGNVFTVNFVAGANGTLTGATSQNVPEGEDCAAVTAVADPGFRFVGWTGDFTGTDNPLTIVNVTADLTITANFSPFFTVITPAGQTVGAAVQSGGEITSFTSVDPETIPEDAPGRRPADADMPHGLFGLNLNVPAPGGQAVVVIVLPEPAPSGFGWVKYIQGQGWFDFTSSAVFNADRTEAYLTLVDGGAGDADGLADGVITDPSGPYQPFAPFIPTNTDDDDGGYSTCFISTLMTD